jgi:methylated-DNA-protein-cysteine methyltransferase related protein
LTAPVSLHAGILAVVARIPSGRVATYGQVARLAGLPGHARLVGYALSALPDRSPVPWHRVVNAEGRISRRSTGSGMDVLQRLRLKRERVSFDRKGVISLARFRWQPRRSA